MIFKNKMILITIGVITVFVALTIIIIVCILTGQESSKVEEVEESGICDSEECVKLVKRMKSLMKPKLNPCHDFYEYSCGNYPKNAEEYYELSNHINVNRNKLKEFLKNYKPETKSEKIAMVFMEKCRKTRSDSGLNEDIWKSDDLTDLLIEAAKVEPDNPGFIKNLVFFKNVNGKYVLYLYMGVEFEDGHELKSTLDSVEDSSLDYSKEVTVYESLNKFTFLNLEKYLLGFLPEEHRKEFKGSWVATIFENHFVLLQKVVKKVGVKKVKEVLKKRWKKKLKGYLVNTQTPDKDCFEKAEKMFPGTLGMIFIKNFVTLENIRKANRLFEDLRRVFNEVLDENTWLDQNLKNLLNNELDAIKSSLGIPDEHKDVSNIDRMYARIEKEQKVEDQSYLTLVRNILKMNSEETFLRVARRETVTYLGETMDLGANYAAITHRISIAPVIMNFPYIDPNLPKWNMIASVGFIMAHEMGHAFDATNFFVNETNVAYSMGETMKKEFDKRIDCIIKKYDKFKFSDGSFSNGTFTKKEDSADMVGFNLAYKLFKKIGGHRKMAGFENQTMDQMYFQRMAYTWCGVELKGDLIAHQKKDVHSALKFRVNGVMSNSVEFARAFGCKKGSLMNPEKKCPLFK